LTSLGEWAASIAHEINQPLQNIMLSAEDIDMELREEKINRQNCKNGISDIYEDINRVQKIIDHIRIFSSSQKSEIIEDFDINQVIESAISMIQQKFSKLNIPIQTQFNKNLPLLSGNPFKYEQVVLNLLSNAKDALNEKNDKTCTKQVKISTYQEENELVFEIQDNGIGMDSHLLTKIKQPFFTTKALGKGTGLGLSISQNIINEMNGKIRIESEKSIGTVIRVCIPIQTEKETG